MTDGTNEVKKAKDDELADEKMEKTHGGANPNMPEATVDSWSTMDLGSGGFRQEHTE